MDFKSMSDHELLLIINLKSEIKYTHDQLQDARQVYIERMYSRTVSAMSTSSALKTETTGPVQDKKKQPAKTGYTSPTSFDFSKTAEEQQSVQEEKPESAKAPKAPPTAFDFMAPEEYAEKPASAETAVLTAIPLQEEKTEPLQLVMSELSEDTPVTQPSEDIHNEEKPVAQSYTYIPSDESEYRRTPSAERTAHIKRENPFLSFLHGIFAYFLMPVIMIKELCTFASCMVLLVTNFKSTTYHICTVTDFVYMIFILFVWYFALNKRATAVCKILIFAEIFRAASELMMMQSFFGNTISIIYISLLLLASFSIRRSR